MSWMVDLLLHAMVGVSLAVLDRLFSSGRIKQGTWLLARHRRRQLAVAVSVELLLLLGVWLSGRPELLLGLALLIPHALALLLGVLLVETALGWLTRHGHARLEVLPAAQHELPEPSEQQLAEPEPSEQQEAEPTPSPLDRKLDGY